jgi:PAS domain S-box-containing protein
MPTLSSEHLLNLLVTAYPGLVCYVDQKYCYQFANAQYLEWFGLGSLSIQGKSLKEVLGSEEFLAHNPYLEQALEGKVVKFYSTFDHRILGRREIELTYHPDINAEGEVQGIISLTHDITEQKQSEKVAQENEARFRSLTEVMPQLVWVADGEGMIIYFNESWPRVTGTSLKENLGNGWLNVLHPEDRITTVLNWSETLKSKNNQEAEYRLKMADGTYRWHVSRAIAIKNEHDQIVRWVGTTTDIEEQKNARDLALQEKKRMYSLLMQAPVAISVCVGPEHTFELVNEPAKLYFGKDVTGLKVREALPEIEEQGYVHLLDEIYHSGVGKFFSASPITFKQPDGSMKKRYMDLFYEPIKDENNLTTGILNMVVEVTNQVNALHKAEEKERNLEEALKARDEFLSIASHELKTPLTSLKLQAQLTLRSLAMNREFSPERQAVLAHQTSDLVGRLTRLIDDMLDVSRIKTGKLKLDKASHDLAHVVREVVFGMTVLFEAAGLSMPSIHAPESLMGEWDRFRLEQVLENLLTNAIRYGLRQPIRVEVTKENDHALISVKDQGYGIAAADLTRIFGRFERAINSSEVSGLGLGLFITKEIVESHGGKIWVESTLGQGSTFFVKLPLSNK